MSPPLKGNSFRIAIHGLVQGIGFRPFVANSATRYHITGWVANTSFGVSILAQGTPHNLRAFFNHLKKHPPSLSKIDRFIITKNTAKRVCTFSIVPSKKSLVTSADLPADIALCDACRHELNDPSDRRFRYPFINCTHCGPRFSITRTLPYDRPSTTMESFRLCPACRTEYDDPHNRRYHAQPNACPVCGPFVQLVSSRGGQKIKALNDTAITKTIALLQAGKIIAIKSIGGYHLSCDAHNHGAINRLRSRKNRPDKPFAVMVPDLTVLRRICILSADEEKLLTSPQAPIVILRKKVDALRYLPTIEEIAPNNAYLGVMMPYTPLHAVLFSGTALENAVPCLIMTSGNRLDEPICRDEKNAFTKLARIADYFLTHNRPIHNRCDDSIVQMIPGTRDTQILRRSRGYIPTPVALPSTPGARQSVLAVGAELKNTFSLTRGGNAYPSPYIGDLDTHEAMDYFNESLQRFSLLLKVNPHVIVYDSHPDYMSTRFARTLLGSTARLRGMAVQHHHAHLASVCAEHAIAEPVIGFSFDGTGLGNDGNIWGGECFTGHPGAFERFAHLEYFALPGADRATREIWRIAVSLVRLAGIDASCLNLPRKFHVTTVNAMIEKKVNSPLCSSIGRLFDGVAALLGVRYEVSFEAQAAMQLEALAVSLPVDKRPLKGYNFSCRFRNEIDGPTPVSIAPLVREIIHDKKRRKTDAYIAYRFHLTLVDIMVTVAREIRRRKAIDRVIFSGGVFQNRLLLSLAVKKLKANKFAVAYNRLVPPNDGGIALGQAWTALKKK